MDSIDNAVVKRQLPCQLTAMEVADAAMLAATRQGEYDKVEEEKKRVLGRYTHRLKSLRAEMSIESKKATTGVEDRFVECVWCVDRDRCKAVLRRTDTQDIVQERDLTKSDIQLTMTELLQFLEEAAESPAAVEAEGEDVGDTVELFPDGDVEGQAAELEESDTPTGEAVNAFLGKDFHVTITHEHAREVVEKLEAMDSEPITAENCPINPKRAEILARDGV